MTLKKYQQDNILNLKMELNETKIQKKKTHKTNSFPAPSRNYHMRNIAYLWVKIKRTLEAYPPKTNHITCPQNIA